MLRTNTRNFPSWCWLEKWLTRYMYSGQNSSILWDIAEREIESKVFFAFVHLEFEKLTPINLFYEKHACFFRHQMTLITITQFYFLFFLDFVIRTTWLFLNYRLCTNCVFFFTSHCCKVTAKLRLISNNSKSIEILQLEHLKT